MITARPTRRLILAISSALSLACCSLVNLTPPIKTPVIEVEHNSLGGKMPISDWFNLQVMPVDFDADKDGILTMIELYTYTKATRTIFDRSPIVIEADEDKNGFVTDNEWDRIVAKKRLNGQWLLVFDIDKDSKLSIDEELAALSHIKSIREYYDDVVTNTAMFWRNTFDLEKCMTYDTDKDSELSDEEIGAYLTAHKDDFIFSFDWNGDGEVIGHEQATASQVVLETMGAVNEYMMDLKVLKYRDFF